MCLHRGNDLVTLVEELLVHVADALHDGFDGDEFRGDVVELGLALTYDFVDGVDVFTRRRVVGVAVLCVGRVEARKLCISGTTCEGVRTNKSAGHRPSTESKWDRRWHSDQGARYIARGGCRKHQTRITRRQGGKGSMISRW